MLTVEEEERFKYPSLTVLSVSRSPIQIQRELPYHPTSHMQFVTIVAVTQSQLKSIQLSATTGEYTLVMYCIALFMLQYYR